MKIARVILATIVFSACAYVFVPSWRAVAIGYPVAVLMAKLTEIEEAIDKRHA